MTPEPTATSRATQSYESQETPAASIHPILDRNGSVTLAELGDVYVKEQHLTETNSSAPSGPHQTVTTSRLVSGVSQETSIDSSTGLPLLTGQNSTTALPLLPVTDGTMKQKEEKTTPQDPDVSRLKETRNRGSATEVILLKNVHHSKSAGSPPVPQPGPWSLPSKSWMSQTKPEISRMKEEKSNPSTLQAPSPRSIYSDLSQRADQQQTPSTSFPKKRLISTSPISSQYLVHPTKRRSVPSTLGKDHPSLLELLSALSHHEPSSYLTKHSEYSPSEPTARLKQTSKNQHQPQIDAPSNNSLEPPRGFLETLTQSQPQPEQQTQTSGAPQSLLISRVYPAPTLSNGKEVIPAPSGAKMENPNFASTPSAAPPSTQSFPYPGTEPVAAASRHRSSVITSLQPPGRSTAVLKETFSPRESVSSSTAPRNQPQTPPALSALPSPSPISAPPHTALLQPFPSFSLPVSSLKPPLGSPHDRSSVHVRTSPSFATSQHIPNSTPTRSRAATSIGTSTSTPSLFSADPISSTVLSTSSGSTSSHPEPSAAPSRARSQPFASTSFSVTHQQFTKDHGSLIQDPSAPSESQRSLSTLPPPRMVPPNPEPYPNFDSPLKANINIIKPHPPETDNEPEHPTNPARTPGKEGKFPDVVSKHSAWELGMLLGCSVGLGMVLVVGLRYMYRQACGKRTEVTLNDREQEYAQGERGLIHVQECGDLVRVRRIRDNSFVFLAEYNIPASPGD